MIHSYRSGSYRSDDADLFKVILAGVSGLLISCSTWTKENEN